MDLQTLIDDLAFLDDWSERYRYIIDLGKQLPPLDNAEKVEANRVRGCVSQVWIIADALDRSSATLRLRADSDALIVRGLLVIVLAAFADKTLEEITTTDLEATFEQIGLRQHLSPNRSNGMSAMVTKIKQLAVQQLASEQHRTKRCP